MWYFGWVFILLSGVFAIMLLTIKNGYGERRGDTLWRVSAWSTAGCWVVGCLLLLGSHYYFILYTVNVLVVGRLILRKFTNRRWN